MAAKPISQSDTRWVKKEGKRGYVEQVSTGKRVTGRVALVKDTTKGKAGTTQRYKAGTGLKQTGKAKPKGGGNGTGSAGGGSGPSASEKAAAAARAAAAAKKAAAAAAAAGSGKDTKAALEAAKIAKLRADMNARSPVDTNARRASQTSRAALVAKRKPSRKARVAAADRPSLKGALSNYADWSRKTNQGIYDYFR